MYQLTHVKHDEYGWDFLGRHRDSGRVAQLNVSTEGNITTYGFVEYYHLAVVDPESTTTIIKLNDSALWMHTIYINTPVSTRLIEIDVKMHDEAAKAVNETMIVLNELAEAAGVYRRRLHG